MRLKHICDNMVSLTSTGYYLMLSLNIIIPFHHPILSSVLSTPCYHTKLSFFDIIYCYHPLLSYHIIISCYQSSYIIILCYHPLLPFHVIIQRCNLMLSCHVIIPCYHPMCSSPCDHTYAIISSYHHISSSHIIPMLSSDVIISCYPHDIIR
jgi:hypothetical protein